jgi:hypothetical protein
MKKKKIIPVLLAAACALVILLGAVSVQAALDRTTQPFTSDKYNAITKCEYDLTSGGKVKATLTLNTAYQGISPQMWYICYLTDDVEEPVIETVSAAEMKAESWKYTLGETFDQNIVVLAAAYTDTMAKNWEEPGDLVELLDRGYLLEIPSEPTDPKEKAETLTAAKKEKTFSQTISISGSSKDFYYLKMVTKKDTLLTWTKWTSSGSGSDIKPKVAIYKEGDDPRFSDREEGDIDILLPGTYWICFRNWYSPQLRLQVAFTYRHLIPTTGIKWTVDGKTVTDTTTVLNFGSKVKGVLQPSDTDGSFQEPDPWGYNYDGLTDIEVSKNGKSFTAKIAGTYRSGADTISVTVYDRHFPSRTNGTVEKNYTLDIARSYGGMPYLDGHFHVYHNSVTFDPNVVDSNLYLEIRMKSGSKWKVKYDGPAMGEKTIKGLKQNKKYTFKLAYYYKSKSGKKVGKTKAVVATVKTGSKTKPVINSVRVSNVTKKSVWQPGHWINGTVKDVWQPGKWVTHYNFTVKVTLKKAPSGILGLMMINNNVSSGNNATYKKGKGKTFTFKCSSTSRSFKVNFRFYSDKKYGGLSPLSKVKTIRVA